MANVYKRWNELSVLKKFLQNHPFFIIYMNAKEVMKALPKKELMHSSFSRTCARMSFFSVYNTWCEATLKANNTFLIYFWSQKMQRRFSKHCGSLDALSATVNFFRKYFFISLKCPIFVCCTCFTHDVPNKTKEFVYSIKNLPVMSVGERVPCNYSKSQYMSQEPLFF